MYTLDLLYVILNMIYVGLYSSRGWVSKGAVNFNHSSNPLSLIKGETLVPKLDIIQSSCFNLKVSLSTAEG